jgi:hypothetical protein
MRIARLLPLVACAVLSACSEKSTLAPNPDVAFDTHGRGDRGGREISVITRNMYIGADVDPVMAALASGDAAAAQAALVTALQTLQRTDYATRIKALAEEIAKNRPEVVGIQEAWQLDILLTALGLGTSDYHADLGAALMRALDREGLHYRIAAKNTTTDATLESGAIHIVDHDMLLADADHVRLQGSPVAGIYQYNLGTIFPGVTVLRGYVSRQAEIDGIHVLLVNTHLESGADPQIAGLRALQASELAQVIGAAPRLVLTGDFNDEAGSPMYQVLAGSQLTDTWAALRPGDPGLTCCQAPDLSNNQSLLNQRIDFIWTRGVTGRSGDVQGDISLVSARPSARVRGAFGRIWPSDHAGVVADLKVASQP